MEIQLTRTKTITIGGGGKSKGPKKSHITDVVGLDLFAPDARGCPAVRLTVRRGVLKVSAAGFVPPPPAALPASWEEAAKGCVWSLPAAFQAPNAAIAVTSPDMFLTQTTLDAFRADLTAGGHKSDEVVARPKRIGIRRETPKAAPAATAATLPPTESGVPVSNGGTRFVMKRMEANEGFVMEAGLPEYQILWLSRLLPEGHRPTANSIQLHPAAITASVLKQKEFLAAGGSTLALFVSNDGVHIAGYREGDLVLYRTCRGAPGWGEICEKLKVGLGLDDVMLSGVLNDTLIDPRPVLDPILAPIIDELSISRDYLIGKLGLEPKSVLLSGVPAGVRYWSALAEERARLSFVAPGVFDGLERADRLYLTEGASLDGHEATAFAGALGAALAYMGEEASV